MELASLVDPQHTTILCMEMQRGVVGDLVRFSGPGEAVAGFPTSYGEQVLQHTLDGLATLTTVDELLSIWG